MAKSKTTKTSLKPKPVNNSGPTTYEFPCLPIQQGKNTLYSFVTKAATLWSITEINKRDSDKDTGYQRALSTSRVRAVKDYIQRGYAIPNSILVTFNASAKYDQNKNCLVIPNQPNSGWIIDGQHRLAGAHEASSDIEISVIAFINLPEQEQIFQFVTVNREAKGVPSSLYLDLLDRLPPGKTELQLAQERATDIAHELRKDESSPFYQRIVVANATRGFMSLTNFVRKVAPLVRPTGSKSRFYQYTFQEQKLILDNYFKSLKSVFPDTFEERKLTFLKTLGFGAMINVLPFIFDRCIKERQGFRIEDIIYVLKHVEDYDFNSWDTIYGTGTEAENNAGDDFLIALQTRLESKTDGQSVRLT